MESKRLYYWDNVKFLLILLVVAGHFIDLFMKTPYFKSMFIFIYSFHMPLFVFISGLFSKSAVKGDKLKPSRVVNFFILGLLLKLGLSAVKYIYSQPAGFSLFIDYGVPWYMFAMAQWLVITYLIKNANPVLVLSVSLLAALTVGFFDDVGDYFAISRVIVFFPYFILGYYADPSLLCEKIKKHKFLYPAAAAVLILFVLVCIFKIDIIYKIRPMLTGRNPYSVYDNKLIGLLARAVSYVLAAAVSVSVLIIVPRGKLFISRFGSRTLQVYFLHHIILFALKYSGIKAFLLQVFGSGCWWIFYLLIAVILTFVLSLKIFSYPFTAFEKLIKRVVGEN